MKWNEGETKDVVPNVTDTLDISTNLMLCGNYA